MQNGNGSAGGSKGAKSTIEKMYQKKSQLEHILLRPDTYIGSVERLTENMWVFDPEKENMIQREISYVPGLYKIFDEILVNAAGKNSSLLSACLHNLITSLILIFFR